MSDGKDVKEREKILCYNSEYLSGEIGNSPGNCVIIQA